MTSTKTALTKQICSGGKRPLQYEYKNGIYGIPFPNPQANIGLFKRVCAKLVIYPIIAVEPKISIWQNPSGLFQYDTVVFVSFILLCVTVYRTSPVAITGYLQVATGKGRKFS